MTITSALYSLFISPLELFFESLFSVSLRFLNHPGLSIIFISLAMNFLILPLYYRADKIQVEAAEKEKKMGFGASHIKKTFKGPERFMMLRTYYRQCNYKPFDALKSSVSLLLEIPFFIAAYHFLSHLDALKGVSFGPIADLGAADGMITLFGCPINFLPILMTVINIVASLIYLKGMSFKSKIQLYGMALIFLVLLYQSPAGLVFYWTLNNLFSLFKNIFYKLKNPKKVFCFLCSVIGIILLPILFSHLSGLPSWRHQAIAIVAVLLLQLPLVSWLFYKKHRNVLSNWLNGKKQFKKDESGKTFWLFSIGVALLTGLLIPSAVMVSSPEEFLDAKTLINPLIYILNAGLLAFGTFVIWPSVFYFLATPFFKKMMSIGAWCIFIVALVNYFFFGSYSTNLSNTLVYDLKINVPVLLQVGNLILTIALILAMGLLWEKMRKSLLYIAIIIPLAILSLSMINIFKIHNHITSAIVRIGRSEHSQVSIPLSSQGKNVIVLMMDKAINGYIPYLFRERPELKRQFAGFTYFPNTLSYGPMTNVGVPGVYGGYEYTPQEMFRRKDESLAKKHDEALKVMPVLFDREDFDVTVCDPSYAGYCFTPDLSIYDPYPNINAYILNGRYNINEEKQRVQIDNILRRNFFCYGFIRTIPVILQLPFYAAGTYLEPNRSPHQIVTSISTSRGVNLAFLSTYNVLTHLSQIISIKRDSRNTFLMISNETAHDPLLLQEPEYIPSDRVDNTYYDRKHSDRFVLNGRHLHVETPTHMKFYHVNMAAMIQMGKLFDFMREKKIYDNTRIILVADHGAKLGQFDDMKFGERSEEDAMLFNPLLMVKDFGANEFKVDNHFMTNADTPSLAFKGLISNPVNPFTGKKIGVGTEKRGEQIIFYSPIGNIFENNGNTFRPGRWFSVKDNIFDMRNWKILTKEPDFDRLSGINF